MNNHDQIFKMTKEWLIASGIQNIGCSKEISGGFNSWYDLKKKIYPYIYSEITGYGMTALLYLNKIENENILVRRAELAAEWLLSYHHKSGGIPSIYSCNKETMDTHSFKAGSFHSFDNGVILCGLTNLYKVNNKQKYLNYAIKIAEYLIKSMQKMDGGFYAIYDLIRDALIESPKRWSTQSGVYHAKIAIGLLNLYDLVENPKYLESVKKVCDNTLKFQQKDGRFVTFQMEDKTHIHPHCYAAEGLLHTGLYLNNQEYIESAKKATEWLLNNQLPNGGIPCFYEKGKFLLYERSDTLAQTLRLGLLLLNYRILSNSYNKNLEKLLKRLCSFQCKSNEKTENGGFLFGYDLDGTRLMHINSWCSMFALQAIKMYQQRIVEKLDIDMDLFT